jgi:hypothetical protein
MAKIAAIQCDMKSCGKMDSPADGADMPGGWFLVDIAQEGQGNMEGRVFCSWACISRWANDRIVSPPKRTRRTRAEMLAAAADKSGAPA